MQDLFQELSEENYRDNPAGWREAFGVHINNIDQYTSRKVIELIYQINKCAPSERALLQAVVARLKNKIEKYEQTTLTGKGYFSPERRAVRRLLSALNEKKSVYSRQLLLLAALSGEDKEAAKLVDLPLKSTDGKRTYWLNFAETEAVVIVPELGTPHPDKKFRVERLPVDAEARTKVIPKTKEITEYFYQDIAGDLIITDYVPKKDWSEYDGREAPKSSEFVERLTSLCEKLRNLAEGKPPFDTKLRPYVWTRRDLHRMKDSREKIHLLVPLILHYLGSSDPLFNFNAAVVLDLQGVSGVEGEFRKIIGHFLARMLGDSDKSPKAQEILEFFECAERYQKNNSAEEMEVLKLMGNSRYFDGDAYGLPQYPKARWMWFEELSDLRFYEADPLKWRVLAIHIANEKEKYTPEQRQFLRRKLQEYRAKQYDKDDAAGEYQKIIAAAGSIFDENPRDLFPLGEEKEALIGLMEEIKTAQKWDEIKGKIRGLGESYFNTVQLLSLVQMAEDYPAINFNNDLVRKILLRLENPPEEVLVVLSTAVNKRTPEQHEQLNANLGLFREASIYEEIQKAALTNEIALQVFCAADSSTEQRQYMAKHIAKDIFSYSGGELVQFFNKLKEYKLIQSFRLRGPLDRVNPPKYDETQVEIKNARDKIVAALKAYRNSLFYFNPKRLDISHVIAVLKNPSLQSEIPELIEPEYAEILDKVLRLIPLDVVNAFRQSTKPFRKYHQYELVRTPNGKVFAIDHAQCLGEGAFGVVYVAYEVNESTGKFGKRVAVKFFKRGNTHEEILNETKALAKSFDVKGVVSDKTQTCLVMEYVEGKPIAKDSWSNGTFTNTADISTLPLAERLKAIVMLMAEVSAAHQHRNRGNAFLHRDIRLENVHIEINDKKVKDVRLLDFGLAAFISRFHDPKSVTFPADDGVGTLGFAAPESEKTLKSDMRSLLPTILPILGVYRLFNGQDIDESGSVRYFLLSGLLSGMEKELPIQLRAALFQFITKMESYEAADARPSDDEAFRFFNALYDYCHAEDKAAWYENEYHKVLQQTYSAITPRNAYSWFQHLREEQDPLPETKAEIQRAAEMVFGRIADLSVKNQLRLLKYFIENEEVDDQNRARWENLLKQLAAMPLGLEERAELMKCLNKKREQEPVIVFKKEDGTRILMDENILQIFERLSKTKHYEQHQASWVDFAKIIRENLDNYSGRDLLTILRKINKFNSKNEYDDIRDAVKAKLNAQWSDACAQVMKDLNISEKGPSWNRSAMNNLKAAIEGQSFFAHRYLRNAASQSPNEAVGRVVRKLGKVAA